MRTCNLNMVGGALAALILFVPIAVGGAGEPPDYASATEAYRQGTSALKSGETAAAIPALEYAAQYGVLGAQLKLARLYASGREVTKDDAKAFHYFRQIADQYAEIPPSSPIAKYVGEAFVALGQYHVVGIPGMSLAANPTYAAGLYRHAASYFGNAEAQYQLGRLYLTGEGVAKNPSLAANWLAMAARKQHPASQATLGELLWRGDLVRQRRARGLALLTLAEENAKAEGAEPEWISNLYAKAFANSDSTTRKEAEALLPQLGGSNRAATTAAKTATSPIVVPASGASAKAIVPAPSRKATERDLAPADQTPPASMGLSLDFGASEPGDLKP
ncbi:MAG: tetratricopeptide repeat protein [Methyloceanibacter sp.]